MKDMSDVERELRRRLERKNAPEMSEKEIQERLEWARAEVENPDPLEDAAGPWTPLLDAARADDRITLDADAFDEVVRILESPGEPTQALRDLVAAVVFEESEGVRRIEREFREMVAQMQTREHKKGMDAVFKMTSKEIGKAAVAKAQVDRLKAQGQTGGRDEEGA